MAPQTPSPAGPVSVASATRYTWGSGCDGWHLLSSPQLSVIQERMPPGTSEVRHLHLAAQQFFYVLAGTLTIELEDRQDTLTARQGLHVPAGSPHRVFNPASTPAEFLVVSQPPSHGDRIVSPGLTASGHQT